MPRWAAPTNENEFLTNRNDDILIRITSHMGVATVGEERETHFKAATASPTVGEPIPGPLDTHLILALLLLSSDGYIVRMGPLFKKGLANSAYDVDSRDRLQFAVKDQLRATVGPSHLQMRFIHFISYPPQIGERGSVALSGLRCHCCQNNDPTTPPG